MDKVDLHMHSNYSDGLSTITEIFKLAQRANFNYIAITDHDTAEHWDEVRDIGLNKKVSFILGTEFSSMYKGREIHILGYDYNRNHPVVREILDDYKEANKKWVINMAIYYASKTGTFIDLSDFEYKGTPDKVRLTKYMLDKGYLTLEGKKSFPQLVSQTFKQGGEYHLKRKIKRRRYNEIIDAIHQAGGFAVLAHPQKNRMEEEDILELKNVGLDGLEVYTRKTKQDDNKYKDIAEKLDLYITGGSDFHGKGTLGVEHPKNIFDRFLKLF